MKIYYVKVEYKDGQRFEEVFVKYSKSKEFADTLMGDDKEGNIKSVETKCREIDF